MITMRELTKEEGMATPSPILPKPVETVLKEFKDVMPSELSMRLSPKQDVDHHIELESGTKPPAMSPYCMAAPESEELWK